MKYLKYFKEKKTIIVFFQYSYKIDKKEEDEEGKEESIL
jgi:hypothetical protein